MRNRLQSLEAGGRGGTVQGIRSSGIVNQVYKLSLRDLYDVLHTRSRLAPLISAAIGLGYFGFTFLDGVSIPLFVLARCCVFHHSIYCQIAKNNRSNRITVHRSQEFFMSIGILVRSHPCYSRVHVFPFSPCVLLLFCCCSQLAHISTWTASTISSSS